MITLKASLEEAQEFADALSDVLCWVRGFTAACPEDLNRHPLGISEVRELSTRLKASIRREREIEESAS